MSQTTEKETTLREAARMAQRELGMDLSGLDRMEKPEFLSDIQWQAVLARKDSLLKA